MPSFYPDEMDIDVDEFLNACSKYEIQEVIEALVEDGHLPKNVLKSQDKPIGKLESEFSVKVDKLKEKYYSISNEDEEVLEKIFKKYL